MFKKMFAVALLGGVFAVNAAVLVSEKENQVSQQRISKTVTVTDAAKIDRYLENPAPVIIVGTNEQEEIGMLLNRSFKESLHDNVDKETISRMNKK